MEKINIIVQARMGSTRLPGKVMKIINNKTLIQILLLRLSKVKKINKIVVATSSNSENEDLVNHLKDLNIDFYIGSENDVLNRFFRASSKYKSDIIVRITADCPLISPEVINETIDLYLSSNVHYVSNINPPTFPDGLDVEVFSHYALKKAEKYSVEKYDREHVTPYIRRNFENVNFTNNKEDLSSLRWTVDEKEDFNVVKNIFNYFENNFNIEWKDVYRLFKIKPYLFKENSKFIRNSSSKK